LVSVSRVTEHPILMRSVDNKGVLKNLLNKDSTIRRQDFPEYYKVNGAIYINKINVNLNKETSLNDNRLPYIMDSIYDVDIDEPIDLEIFKMLVSKY
jgi:CMP-N,N'-diacetyllegionaminic acid synthase